MKAKETIPTRTRDVTTSSSASSDSSIDSNVRPSRPSKSRFEPRPSFLDPAVAQSPLQRSEFKGFFNLVAMMATFYIISTNVSFFLRHGTLVGLRSLVRLIPLDMLPAWCALGASPFSAFVLEWAWVKWTARRQRQHRSPPPAWMRLVVQHTLQTTIFLTTLYLLVFGKEWPVVPMGTYLLHMIVLVMKMHSYLVTNAEFAIEQQQQQQQKRQKQAKITAEKDVDGEVEGRTSNGHGEDDSATVKKKEGLVAYPNNVTFSNFFYFLCAPTLVYELNYPRTERIRWGYVMEKCLAAVGVFSVLHIVIDQHVTPVLLRAPVMSLVETISALITPFVFCHVMIFYMMFELILNGIAEVLCFADRRFYDDWWNSTTWDEYARKWNKPVHEWLLRHVYLESLNTYKTSRMHATFITFLTSAILHETVFAVVFRMVRPYLFLLQMGQLPLIYLGRKLKNTRAGNFYFWFGLILGVPLLAALYCREYYYALSLKGVVDEDGLP